MLSALKGFHLQEAAMEGGKNAFSCPLLEKSEAGVALTGLSPYFSLGTISLRYCMVLTRNLLVVILFFLILPRGGIFLLIFHLINIGSKHLM